MKRLALPILLASALLSQLASAQSSSTPIIGYYKFDAPAGLSVWGCNFVAKKDFQGAATSVAPGPLVGGEATTDITVSGATFPAFPLHYVELLTPAASEGRILDIAAVPSPNTIRVLGTVTGTPTFCVRKHNTIGTIFAGGAGIAPFDDSVTVYHSDGTSTLAQFDGVSWDQPDVIVYPGQGFLISKLSPGTITFGGGEISYIKSNQTQVNIYAAAEFNLIAPTNPLVPQNPSDPIYDTLGRKTPTEYGLANLLAPFDDYAFRLDEIGGFESLAVYQYDGSAVSEVGGGPNVSPDYFRVGQAVIIQALSDGEHVLPPTFTVGN